MRLYPAFIRPSENTQMWKGEAGREGWSKDMTEKKENILHYHNLRGKQHVATNTMYSSSVRICTDSNKHMGAHAQIETNTVFMCHLAPDPQSTMEAVRKQCWGARSDRANRKQAAFCIPGQAVQHNTDTGRDTETDHLWPKTIHLPCSPRRAELRWIGFLCFPPFLSFVGSASFFGGEERENQELVWSLLYLWSLDTFN